MANVPDVHNKGYVLHGAGNQALLEDDYLLSSNNRYQLTLQQDGNLVLYDNTGQKVLWASGTNGQAAYEAVMQGDGNFVLYGYPFPDKVLWASNSNGKGNCDLILQDDGNLVIYQLMVAAWATDTDQPPG